MSFYRSQDVDRFKLYLPRQSAWNIMNKLGQSELIHIIPSQNNDSIRHFTLQIKRVEQALQKISNLQEVLYNKKMIQMEENQNKRQKIQDIIQLFNCNKPDFNAKNQPAKINEVIQKVQALWAYYAEISKRIQMLQKEINSCRENIAILLVGEKQYGKAFFENQKEYERMTERMGLVTTNKINYKAGIVNVSQELRFKRTIFRITKGNCLIFTQKLTNIFIDKINDNQLQKVVFFIIYPANNQSYFDRKLTKLISNFSNRIFQYSKKNSNSFNQHMDEQNKTLVQAMNLKAMCQNQLDTFLFQKLLEKYKIPTKYHSNIKKFQYLKYFLIKEKYLYHNLNEMNIYNHFFQGDIFIRKQHVKNVQQLLSLQNKSQLPPGHISPKNILYKQNQKYPSSFVLNDYTRPAQQIVQTYGVPRYKQINPSLFTTVTFPFFFGVMFGDMAHGSIILAFGIILILIHSKRLHFKNDYTQMLLPYRYLITMMGFFSAYCGLIYNDILSISLNIFGSCYAVPGVQYGAQIPRISQDCVYPIGIDPVWSIAENSLNFTNSLKMKISVIIGVIHMTLGVILRGTNDVYFKNFKEFVFVFIPQLVFLIVVFGYMDFLIIYKWFVQWGQGVSLSAAPSIISQMIAIPLSLGSTEGKPLWNQTSQENLQYTLLVIAGICIPVMLLPVPIIKIIKMQQNRKVKPKKKLSKHLNRSNESSEFQNQIKEMLLKRQKQDYSEDQQLHLNDQIQIVQQQEQASQIFVHQIIETIQFILGSVSNTASYLRLWALSLAHSQLSQVFFQKTVQDSLQNGYSGIVPSIFGFMFLAGITIGIMLLMDTMQCFLHTLRLHWVQFQNKFYKGDGFSFQNFSFKDSITQNFKMVNINN